MSLPVSLVQRQVKASEVPLEKLAGNAKLAPAEKLTEVSRQFEAILLRQIFSEAQKPVFQSKYSNESTSGGIYHDLINKELADQVSRSGGIGLGRNLEKQLKQQLKVGETPAPGQTGPSAVPSRKSTTAKRYD